MNKTGRARSLKKKTAAEPEITASYGPLFKVVFIGAWLCCLSSALAVVYTSFESRRSVQALEVLRSEGIDLRVSTGKYELEKSALAAYPRIEAIAAEKLNMSSPELSETVLVVRE